jgi:hypothetical protein
MLSVNLTGASMRRVLNFEPATGRLTMDARFRDPGGSRDGVNLGEKTWPHGFAGKALPHGTVFSR